MGTHLECWYYINNKHTPFVYVIMDFLLCTRLVIYALSYDIYSIKYVQKNTLCPVRVVII